MQEMCMGKRSRAPREWSMTIFLTLCGVGMSSSITHQMKKIVWHIRAPNVGLVSHAYTSYPAWGFVVPPRAP